MGKKLAITVESKHKIGKKVFFTGADVLHHKVKKSFLTKDGVHRLVYSASTIWAKYDCSEEEVLSGTYYECEETEDGFAIGDTFSTFDDGTAASRIYYSEGYDFEPNEGFRGWGGNVATTVDDLDAISGYIVDTEIVYRITNVAIATEYADGSCSFDIAGEVVALCQQGTYMSYTQGSTSYGTIEVGDGELPESGTLIDGSVVDGHCVLEIDGEYYYYTIQ